MSKIRYVIKWRKADGETGRSDLVFADLETAKFFADKLTAKYIGEMRFWPEREDINADRDNLQPEG